MFSDAIANVSSVMSKLKTGTMITGYYSLPKFAHMFPGNKEVIS